MGKTYVCSVSIYTLHCDDKKVGEYETFEEALAAAGKILTKKRNENIT